MRRTYSLPEAATVICGDDMKHPQRWLMRRLRSGEISGYKVGHTWRMREEDVEAALAKYSNTTPIVVDHPRLGLTEASMRRRSA